MPDFRFAGPAILLVGIIAYCLVLLFSDQRSYSEAADSSIVAPNPGISTMDDGANNEGFNSDPTPESDTQTRPITANTQIASLISRFHYKNPDYDAVLPHTRSDHELHAFLNTLDPYSRKIPAEQLAFTELRNKESRIGPGLDYLISDQHLLAVPVHSGPLQQSGQDRAFLLDSINGRGINIADFSTYRFLGHFNPGEKVLMSTRGHTNDDKRSLSVDADEYKQQFVRFYSHGNTLILTIRRFKTGYSHLLKSAIQELKGKHRLIVDLRFSPGGDIYAMTDWLSLFLPEGKTVARLVRNNSATPLTLSTLSGQINIVVPIVILVSAYTASSAEIFARNLHHYLTDVVIIGNTTKGKCLAQQIYPLEGGDGLMLSNYEVLSGDGVACNHSGIKPDVTLSGIEFKTISEIISIIDHTAFVQPGTPYEMPPH